MISNQPVDLPWDNAELVVARDDDDLVAAITEFKRQPGSLGVPDGVRTAQRFARLGLIDEYVLQVHPIAIGAGKRLFTHKAELQLTSAKPTTPGSSGSDTRPANSSSPPRAIGICGRPITTK